MGRKKFLFVSAEKGDLKLTGDEHKIIRDLFPDNHQFVHPIREAYVAFSDLFNLFENNRDYDLYSDIEILHFAGHSGVDGLLFDADESGNGLVSIEKFKEFISWYPNLKIIILNSCASSYIGEKLKEIMHLEVIIETTDTIYERDAMLFTRHLYSFLNKGDEIVDAFGKVQLMFETGDVTITDRGNKRELKGRKIKNKIFPWSITPKGNTKWRLFDNIPNDPADKEIRILHFYINNEQNTFAKLLDTSLRSVYAKLNDKIDLITKVFTSEDFLKIEGDFKKLEYFDSVIFFLTEGFYDQFQALNLNNFYTANCKVSVVNCSGNEDEIEIIKDHSIKVAEDLIFPKIKSFSVKTLFDAKGGSSLTSFLEETFISELKIINSKDTLKNSLIEKELDNQFTSLNFFDQKILTSEFKKLNIFVIEGTSECGHELCIRRILNKAGSNPLPSNTHSITIKKMDDFNSSVDGFWKMLYDEIMNDGLVGDMNDCVMTLLRKAQLGDVILTIEHLNSEQELFSIIHEFWFQFIQNKKVVTNTIKNNVFIFFLNKSYCKTTCCWTETIPELSEKVLNKKFEPITFLEYTTLEDWYSNNLPGIKEFDIYKQLKSNLSHKIKDNSPIGSVVKQICAELGVEGFEKTIMSVNNRYER